MNDLIKISQSKINGAEVNSVNARNIHEYLEVKTPFSMWIDRAIKKYSFMDGEDFTTHTFVNGKATQIDFIVTLDMAKELAMLENNSKGRETRKYFIAIEKEHIKTTLKLPTTYKEALLELIAKEEKIELLELTKAHINNKKTATAMNTASQAIKKVNKLEIELDKSKEYCTIKRMTMINHGQKFSFKLLREISIEMEIPTINVFDANYGTVKAYHKNVWVEAYGLEF